MYFDYGEYAIWHVGDRLSLSIDNRRETVYRTRSFRHITVSIAGSTPSIQRAWARMWSGCRTTRSRSHSSRLGAGFDASQGLARSSCCGSREHWSSGAIHRARPVSRIRSRSPPGALLMPSVPSCRRTRWAAWQLVQVWFSFEHRVEDLAVVALLRGRLQIAGVLHRVLRQLDRVVDLLVLPVPSAVANAVFIVAVAPSNGM